jgi:serine protein kinase
MSAAAGYGIERRVLLLHGPVGSSKSTIVRLLKKGLERYPPTTRVVFAGLAIKDGTQWCPMNEEPLHLFPSGSGGS